MTNNRVSSPAILVNAWQALEKAWNWLARPHPSLTDLGSRRRAQLMMAFALIISFGLLGPLMLGSRNSNRILFLYVLLLVGLIAFFLGRTRFYNWGSVLLILSIVITGFLLVLNGSKSDPTDVLNTTIPLALVIGSILLSLRSQFLLTLVCGFSPMLFPFISHRVTFADGTLRDGGIFLTLGLLLAGITIFRNTLEQDRLKDLGVANQALQVIQSTLEQRVAERTSLAETARREAESARLEAEAARVEVEAQMWLAAGQTALAEKIRGEQSVAQLAENVITQLCQYLGAQAGALYLLDHDLLHMTGSYAFTARPGFDGKFHAGEGLVGQAVIDRQPMIVTRPENSLIISTALLDVLPRQLLVAPFDHDGQVAGMIEMATLSEFTPAHLNFLVRISESMGVAFRTAQTRQRLSQLLMETQQQAEELQTQEEELRAANEELLAQTDNLKSIRKMNAKR
jgi:hypothetical protein